MKTQRFSYFADFAARRPAAASQFRPVSRGGTYVFLREAKPVKLKKVGVRPLSDAISRYAAIKAGTALWIKCGLRVKLSPAVERFLTKLIQRLLGLLPLGIEGIDRGLLVVLAFFASTADFCVVRCYHWRSEFFDLCLRAPAQRPLCAPLLGGQRPPPGSVYSGAPFGPYNCWALRLGGGSFS